MQICIRYLKDLKGTIDPQSLAKELEPLCSRVSIRMLLEFQKYFNDMHNVFIQIFYKVSIKFSIYL